MPRFGARTARRTRTSARAGLRTAPTTTTTSATRAPAGPPEPIRNRGRARGPFLADLAQLPLHLVDLVAEAGGLLEAQVAGGFVHLVGEALDEPAQLVARQVEPVGLRGARTPAASPPPPARRALGVAAGAA